MYQIQALDPSDAAAYERFTFPRFRDELRKQQASSIAGAASCYGYPAGLVLAEAAANGQTGKIQSLFVAPRFRNLGFGQALLTFAEARLRKAGCARLEMSFIDNRNSTSAIKRVLSRCGWDEPALDKEINLIDFFLLMKAGWVDRYHLPANYTVIPWYELSPAKLAELKKPDHIFYPGFASPFKEHALSPHTTSFWLCRREEIAGWVITRQTAPDTLYYDTLFVREELQNTGRGVQLLAEAFKAQSRAEIPLGTHIVLHTDNYANQPLIRFTERRLKPFALQTDTYWNASK